VPKVPAQRIRTVLGAERHVPHDAGFDRSEELPDFDQMVAAVRDRDQAATGPQHSRELGERTVELGNVVEHPVGGSAVELAVTERQLLDVTDSCVDPGADRELHHALRQVDRDDADAKLVLHASRERSGPAADLQKAPRPDLSDGFERDVGRGRPGDLLVQRRTCGEAQLR
jgi:hypothetical protein